MDRGVVRRREHTEFHTSLLLPSFHTSLPPWLLFQHFACFIMRHEGQDRERRKARTSVFSAPFHVYLDHASNALREGFLMTYLQCVPGCIICKYMHDYCIGHKSLQLPKHSLDLGWLAMWREVHVPTSSCLDIPHFVTQNLIGRMEEEEVG